jgi:hypothetical protein
VAVDRYDMTPYEQLTNSDAVYLDTCALVKIDAKEEIGSGFTRVLIYFSRIPVYSSFVGFGEFFSVVGKKKFQAAAGAEGFLFACRHLMIDFDMKKIKRVEPIEDRFKFIQLAQVLLPKHGRLGGGDVWHLMAALHLKSRVPKTVFVSFEPALISAAQSEGLNAVDGNGLDPNRLSEQLKNAGKFVGG